MEIGDLFEVLVALAIVMAGLFGSGKKKKKPEQRRPAPRPARRPAPEHTAPRPRMDQHQATSSDQLLADLARQLEMARGEVVVEDFPEAISLEETSVEVQSLETLEAAGEASHERFHDQYIRPLPEISAHEVRARMPPGGTRAAIVWAEILGPPKGLEP